MGTKLQLLKEPYFFILVFACIKNLIHNDVLVLPRIFLSGSKQFIFKSLSDFKIAQQILFKHSQLFPVRIRANTDNLNSNELFF